MSYLTILPTQIMSYLAVLATIAFLLWLMLERSSWLTSILTSILLFWLTVSATNLCFPFWKIYLPQTGMIFGFILILVCFPLTVFNIVALIKIVKIINQNRKQKTVFKYMFILIALGFLCFGIGFIHNVYQSIPINNLNLYLRDREYIVSLIKAGTLHGGSSCVQNFQLYKSEFEQDECQETIKLPEKYEGLSRNGKVYLTKTSGQLSIRFTHSTYNFGDFSISIVYSSSNNGNGVSQSKWEIK
ncbi:MAG TPA: hypothetical protein V6D48_20000 [Oculatellaceae cyanobacterium]